MKSVYLLQSEGGLYKVGVSKRPNVRVKQLQTGNAEKIVLLQSYETDIPFLLEKSLKNYYSPYRIHGEWFKLSIEEEYSFGVTCEKLNQNLKILLAEGNIFL